MADYSTIEIIMEHPRSSPTCTVLLSDFANMLKAFIGANYLSIAYAFTQSGLVPGILLLLLVASITDHCCHLIVKCKYAAIDLILDRQSDVVDDGGDDDDDENKESEMTAELALLRQKMVRNMTYGDVGRIAFGGPGLLVVNICLMFTQFGFSVGYFIFLGNTMYHLFPYKNTTLEYSVNHSSLSSHSSPDFLNVAADSDGFHSSSSSSSNILSDIAERSATAASTNFLDELTNLSSTASSLVMDLISNSTSATTTISPSTLNTTTTTSSTSMPETVISHVIELSESPDLRLLVLTPLPIFVGFAFLRDIRHLGFVSVAADFAIFIGCVVTMIVLIIGFKTSDTWHMYELMKIPVFFGMVTSAFEGIGTIIPIESSMEGNRHNFSKFLHAAILIMTCILLLFGILGYLRYGNGTAQMINKNMPDGTIGVLINISLCVGVVLTFPLQIYPVIELSEIYLFGNDRLCGPKTRRQRRLTDTINKDDNDSDDDSSGEDGEDEESLLPHRDSGGDVAMTVSDDVSTWKRNLLRIFLVIAAGGIAVLLRDLYAYVTAFIGAVGSSALAYILPCMFHLKLCRSKSRTRIVVKDFIIVVFGIIASIFSLYSTIREVIERVE